MARLLWSWEGNTYSVAGAFWFLSDNPFLSEHHRNTWWGDSSAWTRFKADARSSDIAYSPSYEHACYIYAFTIILIHFFLKPSSLFSFHWCSTSAEQGWSFVSTPGSICWLCRWKYPMIEWAVSQRSSSWTTLHVRPLFYPSFPRWKEVICGIEGRLYMCLCEPIAPEYLYITPTVARIDSSHSTQPNFHSQYVQKATI